MTGIGHERAVKIALLSFAHSHAEAYAPLLAAWPGVELLTTDPDGDAVDDGTLRGRRLAEHLGVAYVDTYEEALAWGPAAVVVCSENARHRDLVVAAASAGAHVLCEKPLATTIEDGQTMVDACRDAGVFLMMAYPVRFSPEFETLRRNVEAGVLGDLLAVVGTNNGKIPVGGRPWFVDPELAGGGALFDHVVHVADLVDALTGGEQPATVRAVTNRILHADDPRVRAETGGLVTATYDDGTVLTIDSSWSHPDAAPNWGGLTLQAVGSEGVIDIDPFGTHVGGTAGGGEAWLYLSTDLDHAMLGHFLAAMRSGTAPQPDGEVGLRTLRLVLDAQESAVSGAVVHRAR
ncbi:oxidoreductase domain protein [Xylanimonas cellulosilytica DSM 15894]|uniref:Oxidoreductase domain protein n=1 Tax=Xylanimonas cellulosilytica (strain DSM 15894 / JCM 12276 / CECT 5975 / KCTC 9989 / LMG 20990 / NBRC 107835 / XIL07) TaxID=446471 RepID=D1BUD0_XYLCX|nr:Gfo/Idh/MocA family oxidoreductase [Xylanimonas cellulosilytica]ACZ31143.1 oxidoreductase domain protein [Xylanimonas cellulosilytica DSM 15894]